MLPFSIYWLAAALAGPASSCDSLPDQQQVDARLSDLFDHDRPAESERALLKLAQSALACGNRELAAASYAQAARAQGIQDKLPEARESLAEAAPLAGTARTRIRILLEQGRIARRERKPEQARSLLAEAFDKAKLERQDALAADAAHMLALIEPGATYLEWTERGLAIAEGSADPIARRWVGNLAYNAGVRLSESSDHQAAALMFARSMAARRMEGDAELIAAAELALSGELARLGRFDEAEAIQRRLLRGATASSDFAAEVKAQLNRSAELRQAR